MKHNKSKIIKKNNQLNVSAILLPIVISVILLLIKLYGYFITGSLSILSSFLDSFMDAFVSGLNMVAVIYASKPPDEDHPFGHNSIEDIVGLIQATFIATSAIFILYKAFDNIINPQIIENNIIGIWIMCISLILSLLIVIYQKYIIRKTSSVVVESDMMHYLTDVLVSGAIIISLFLASYPILGFMDPILASLIAFYILSAALRIGKRSFNNLMDKELSLSEQNKVKKIIANNKNVKGYHAFKTRRSGNRVFVQMHVDLDKNLNLLKAHDIIDELEHKIADLWLESDVIIHMDPV
jgi:ferrous-iron efflux pump FieF